ncbi:DUF2244 domain-containing protein [Devosia ginsengisoli]|uniref:DUF2244 domain-containing protein n=1 Tax=Devosia ginsengisoli TaxID=400770 RepID=UPI0026ED9CB2|nr:DUF2244 domain-containing protein [Devosia ginsengisoli]MCR6671082.1 DUF2244 domain-containing protein [Devosia ginsengisoli]
MPMQATTTTPLFAAALKPDQSPRLFGGWLAFVLAAIAVMPLAVLVPGVLQPTAIAFAIGGAGLVALSLRQSRRRKLTQQVTLWPDQLEIASTDRHGVRTLRRFDPASVRLVLERDENEKTVAMRLRAGTDEMELGAFLKPEDRSSFAKAFGTALRRARQAA